MFTLPVPATSILFIYSSPQHQAPQHQPPQQDMYNTRYNEPARGGYGAPGMSAGSSAPAYR